MEWSNLLSIQRSVGEGLVVGLLITYDGRLGIDYKLYFGRIFDWREEH